MIDSKTKLCCVIGHPVTQSLSPLIHNAACKHLGLNYVFLAFDIPPVTGVTGFIESLKLLNIKGAAITIPHKIDVMKHLDNIDPTAKEIGAVNTIVNENGKLTGYNTDYIGAVKTLEEKTLLPGKTVALIGNGGAARAISFGLKEKGVKVFSIGRKRTQKELDTIQNADIIINASPVGMSPLDDVSPIPSDVITDSHFVFDIVFKPHKTKLLKDAEKNGATLVFGIKMLLYGASEQFKLFTGIAAPRDIMENSLKQFNNVAI